VSATAAGIPPGLGIARAAAPQWTDQLAGVRADARGRRQGRPSRPAAGRRARLGRGLAGWVASHQRRPRMPANREGWLQIIPRIGHLADDTAAAAAQFRHPHAHDLPRGAEMTPISTQENSPTIREPQTNAASRVETACPPPHARRLRLRFARLAVAALCALALIAVGVSPAAAPPARLGPDRASLASSIRWSSCGCGWIARGCGCRWTGRVQRGQRSR
jgi:hypothetical protein